MKIECHILQNFAPSCLNRDDTNTPKSCEFGGFPRARVSSQSWKRAVREFFKSNNLTRTGYRTKRLLSLVEDKLNGSVPREKITSFIEECYSKMDAKRKEETAVLLFISDQEVDMIVACLKDGTDKKAATEKMKNVKLSADIALFGRMLAENPGRNVDAACQVAHAFSTHVANLETDFYTAVDDIVGGSDDSGAAMIGIQGYNSACLYRYALVDVDQLKQNLQQDIALTDQAVEAFLRSFCLAVPSGKQKSMAANSLPSFILLIARENGVSVSLANAFVKPVTGEDIKARSIETLANYHGRLDSVYGLYNNAKQVLVHDCDDIKIGDCLANCESKTLDGAISAIMAKLRGEGK